MEKQLEAKAAKKSEGEETQDVKMKVKAKTSKAPKGGRRRGPKPDKDPKKSNPQPARNPENERGSMVSANTAELITRDGFRWESTKRSVAGWIATSQYLPAVKEMYAAIVHELPLFSTYLSLGEWCHVCMIQLATRIQTIELKVLGIKAPSDLRVQLPQPCPVFQPVWEALHGIGIVDDDTLSIRWIPRMAFPDKDGNYEDDIEAELQFDWKLLWDAALATRKQRETEKQAHVRPALVGWEVEMDKGYGVVPSASSDHEDEPEPDENNNAPPAVDPLEFLKKMDYRNPPDMDEPEYWDVNPDAGPHHDRYGQTLHWDRQLWKDYISAMEFLRAKGAMLSIDMPHTVDGHYGWILQPQTRLNTMVAPAPHTMVPPFAQFFSILFDFGRFRFEDVHWFSVEGVPVRNRPVLLRRWVYSFLPKQPPGRIT